MIRAERVSIACDKFSWIMHATYQNPQNDQRELPHATGWNSYRIFIAWQSIVIHRTSPSKSSGLAK